MRVSMRKPLLFLVLLVAVLVMATSAFALPVKPGVKPDPQMVQLYRNLVIRARAGGEPGHAVIRPTPPVQGSYRGIVLLVSFSDVAPDSAHTTDYYDNLVFDAGNPHSVHSYYVANSSNVPGITPLDLTGNVFGWYQLDDTRAHYVNGAGGVSLTEPNCATVVEEAIAKADADIDFSQYDANGDGYVDALWIVAVGQTWQESGSSDDFATFYATLSDVFGKDPIEVDGVKIDWFMFCGEDESTGAFAHEMGHNLGLLDMYDVSYQGFGLGMWSLMGAGSWGGPGNDGSVPSMIDGFNRRLLGWVNETKIVTNTTDVSLDRAETSNQVATLWPNGDEFSSVYFLVENRQKTGFDEYLPGDGLLVYRVDNGLVDFNYANGLNQVNTDPSWYGIDLLQADGNGDLYDMTNGNAGDAGDPFPGSSNVTTLDETTTPNTLLQGGAHSNVALTNISSSGNTMTFDAQVGAAPLLNLSILSPKEAEKIASRKLRVYATIADEPAGSGTVNSVKLQLDGGAEVDVTGSYADGILDYAMDISALSEGYHTVKITAGDSLGSTAEDEVTFMLEYKQLPDGLQLVGVPYELDSGFDTPNYVFNGPDWSVKWNTASAAYEQASSPLKPGEGVWVRRAGPALATVQGVQTAPESYTVDDGAGGDLAAGWHLISDPFNFSVAWASVQVRRGTELKSLEDAVASHWLKPTLYWYDQAEGYEWATAPNGQLDPWVGYWVKLEKACKLIILPVPAKNVRATGSDTTAAGWKAQLIASTKGAQDAANFFGESPAALDGYDTSDVLEPPRSPAGLSLAFVNDDWGVRSGEYAQDLRSPAGTTKRWRVKVQSKGEGETVTLRWPDLSQVPRTLDLVLVDEQTGRRVAMRTISAYCYTASSKAPRYFTLEARQGQEAALSVTGLKAAFGNTRGSAEVSFDLAKDAYITVGIYSLSGALVKVVTRDELFGQGHNVVVWTGTDEAGRPVSNGTYLVEVKARDDEGRLVRATRTFVVLK